MDVDLVFNDGPPDQLQEILIVGRLVKDRGTIVAALVHVMAEPELKDTR
jgi:hypothetical protein